MATNVYLNSQRLQLTPQLLIGEGGEAEIFDLTRLLSPGQPMVAKIWKPPSHPDFQGNAMEAVMMREKVRRRIEEYGRKIKQFPTGLPSTVIAPLSPLNDKVAGVPVGFVMPFIQNGARLRDVSQKKYREANGITARQIVRIFQNLHATVVSAHSRGIVIGDFNNLNVLVVGEKAFLVDSDSMQFGGFLCSSYTTRYVDPLLCETGLTIPEQKLPHTPLSDWYAFTVMLFEAFLCVHPYSGVFSPKKKSDFVPHDARPLRRISIFHPEVTYPQRGSYPLSSLPTNVRSYFEEVFHKDKRQAFPTQLLADLLAHVEGRTAKAVAASPAVPAPPAAVLSQLGNQVFATQGDILLAVFQDKLRVLYLENGEFKRENGQVVFSGALSPEYRFDISGNRTLIAKSNTLVVQAADGTRSQYMVDVFQGRESMFGANAKHYFWLSGGQLFREGDLGPIFLGNVLQNQTKFWVGPSFGIGLYRAGGLTEGFLFDTEKPGLRDVKGIPPLRGELLDWECVFSHQRAWLFATTAERGKVLQRCTVVDSNGRVTATLESEEGVNLWLDTSSSKQALTVQENGGIRHLLFAITDNGPVGIEEINGALIQQMTGSDTQSFRRTKDLLFDPARGFLSVQSHEIKSVQLRFS